MTKRKRSPPSAHNLSGNATMRIRMWSTTDLSSPPTIDTGYVEVGRLMVGGRDFSLTTSKPKRPTRRKRT